MARKRPFGFNVISHVSGNLGIAVTARNLLRMLQERGIPFATVDLDPGLGRHGFDRSFDRYRAGSLQDLAYAINLIVLPPVGVMHHLPSFKEALPDRLQAAFSMWELPALPKAWTQALQACDVLVAQSPFIRHAFEFNLSNVPVLPGTHPLYLPDGIASDRARFGIPHDTVAFLTGFEPWSDPRRKNPQAAIDAFTREFGDGDNVRLVIKLNNAMRDGKPHPVVEELRQRAASDPRLQLVTESLPYDDVLRLYASCDVFVSLHRAEGLGLGPMEAMALGKAVIATGWSGNMAYMDHANSCPVGYDLVAVDGSIGAYSRDFLGQDTVWADARVEEASLWMRRLAEDPGLRAAIGQRAAGSIHRHHEEARRGVFVDDLRRIWEHREWARTKGRAAAFEKSLPVVRDGAGAQARVVASLQGARCPADVAAFLAQLPPGWDKWLLGAQASMAPPAGVANARVGASGITPGRLAALAAAAASQPEHGALPVLLVDDDPATAGPYDVGRQLALSVLAGSGRGPRLAHALATDAEVGVWGAGHLLVRAPAPAGARARLLRKACAALDLPLPAAGHAWFKGGLAWVHPRVLARLRRLEDALPALLREAGGHRQALDELADQLPGLAAAALGMQVRAIDPAATSPEAPYRSPGPQVEVAPGGDLVQAWLASRDQEGARARLLEEDAVATPALRIVVLGDPAGVEDSLRLADGRLPHGIVVDRIDPAGAAAGLAQRLRDTDADWWLLVQPEARFLPAGLEQLRRDLAAMPDLRAAYADEVVVPEEGDSGGLFRPDFNLDYLLSHPAAMARHWIFRREALLDAGGFAPEDGSAFELGAILRLVEQGGAAGIGHLAEPLLRAAPPPFPGEDARGAILRHLHRRGYPDACVADGAPGTFRLLYGHAGKPLVSIIVPTRDQLPLLRRCIESLMEKTAYPHYEILIVDNDSRAEDAKAWLDGLEAMGLEQVRVLRYPHAFNYSAMNNLAAREARGEYLLLLNNDTAVLHPEWLDAMLNHAQRPEVGIVGAKLLHPDGSLQHAGVLLGLRGPAEHPFLGGDAHAAGPAQRLVVDQDLGAVTGACLLVRRAVYEQVGGLDEEAFAVSYNDIDLCLKVAQAGWLVVWTPHAMLMHVGSVTQKQHEDDATSAKRARFEGEQDRLYARWLPLLARDPAYNRHLSLRGEGFELETCPELMPPAATAASLPRVLAYPADRGGCGHYRAIQPLTALAAAGRVDGRVAMNHLWPAELERLAPDVVVFQRQLRADQLRAMQRACRHARARTVFELDDLPGALPEKCLYRMQMDKDVDARLREALAGVERVVVSTPALADALRDLVGAGAADDIRVVRNRLPPAWWGGVRSRRRDARKPRVGWAGGAGHTGDLLLLSEVVRSLADEVDWVFFGMCPESMLAHAAEFVPGVERIEDYPAALAALDLDLAVAPLEDNPFNRCKSNLKLLEYGACGVPVVCSDVGPYRDDALPVTRVRNRPDAWREAIRGHLAEAEASARQGEALREAVLHDWMLDDAALEEWMAAWGC